MSVDQTRNIIDHAREFHQQVAEYYHRLADTAEGARARLLLDFMSEHEQRLATALADYEASAPEKLLNTWLQEGNETDDLADVCEEIRQLQNRPSINIDDLVGLGIKVSECLLAVYRDLAERAEPSTVRQVFENLVAMEERAQQQFARDAGRMSDL